MLFTNVKRSDFDSFHSDYNTIILKSLKSILKINTIAFLITFQETHLNSINIQNSINNLCIYNRRKMIF